MPQIIDYNELIKAYKEGVNRYYFQKPVYQKKETPGFVENNSPAGFTTPGPDYNAGWEQTSALNYSKDMTEEELKRTGQDAYLKHTVTPESVLGKYFPGWEEREANKGSSGGFSFEMPSYEMPTFESIYGMTQEEWLAKQQEAQDLAAFEPAWAARESALTSAMEAVDKQIRQYESYAAMTGQSLDITKEMRDEMISNMFADMFTIEQESYIDKIMGKYGLEGAYSKKYQRGKEGTFGSDTSIYKSATGGQAGVPTTILTDEEEVLGDETVLGG